MNRKKEPRKDYAVEVHALKGIRKGALIKEELWREDGRVVSYNLAYINLKLSRVDHGRILGFDNSHGYHHRHFRGNVEAVPESSYEAVYSRFIAELHALWKEEDAENG